MIGRSQSDSTYAVPGLIGLFWGAPLITREIETGTFRLVWTQSVMRSRWLAIKVGLIGLVALTSAGLLSLMASWWMTPIYQATAKANSDSGVDRLAPAVFGANGIVPLGYAAFGFALGLAFGVLIRRTIPAMAATLAVFAGIQIAWPRWIRPHLHEPASRHLTAQPVEDSTSWRSIRNGTCSCRRQPPSRAPGYSANQTIDPAGHHSRVRRPRPAWTKASRRAMPPWPGCTSARSSPTSRPAGTGPSSGTRPAIFLALAIALIWFCFWQVSRRG